MQSAHLRAGRGAHTQELLVAHLGAAFLQPENSAKEAPGSKPRFPEQATLLGLGSDTQHGGPDPW